MPPSSHGTAATMPERPATEVLDGIEPLLDRYDGFLVDQFGVLYDGVRALAGARGRWSACAPPASGS